MRNTLDIFEELSLRHFRALGGSQQAHQRCKSTCLCDHHLESRSVPKTDWFTSIDSSSLRFPSPDFSNDMPCLLHNSLDDTGDTPPRLLVKVILRTIASQVAQSTSCLLANVCPRSSTPTCRIIAPGLGRPCRNVAAGGSRVQWHQPDQSFGTK